AAAAVAQHQRERWAAQASPAALIKAAGDALHELGFARTQNAIKCNEHTARQTSAKNAADLYCRFDRGALQMQGSHAILKMPANQTGVSAITAVYHTGPIVAEQSPHFEV